MLAELTIVIFNLLPILILLQIRFFRVAHKFGIGAGMDESTENLDASYGWIAKALLADRATKDPMQMEVYKFRMNEISELEPHLSSAISSADVPKPRSGHRLVYYKGSVFAFGGFNPFVEAEDKDLAGDPFWLNSRPLFKELWRFCSHSRNWKKLSMKPVPSIPEQMASFTWTLVGSKALLFGGTGAPFGLSTSKEVNILDLETCKWRKMKPAAKIVKQINIGLEPEPMDVVQDNENADVPVVDPAEEDSNGEEENGDNDAQENLEELQLALQDDALWATQPQPLYGQAVTVDGRFLYSVGGTSGFHYHMDVHRLDLESGAWLRLHKASTTPDEDEPRPR